MATKAFLEQAYLAYFGRPIDPNGVAAFVNSTETEVENAFWASPESQALYGEVFGLQQINMVYNILFGRDAEPAGLAYWANQIIIGALTPAGAAIGILRGALNDDIIAVNNKLAASAAFTAGLDTTEEILGFAGDAAAAVSREWLATVTMTPATQEEVDAAIVAAVAVGNNTGGQTFTLTTGQDVIMGTAGNDIILGVYEDGGASTLTLGDVISGGEGNDTLTISSDSNSNLSFNGKTITGVENVVVENASDGLSEINFAGVAFSNVTVDVGLNNSDVNFNLNGVAATSAVTIQNIAGDAITYADINFNSSSAATGSTTVTYQDLDVNEFYSVVDASFSAATDYAFNLNVSNVDSNDNFNVNANIDLGAADVALSINVDVVNAVGDDVNFYLDFNTNGVASTAAVVNITDSNVNDFEINIDNNSNGTGDQDVLTLNLSGVNVDGNSNLDFYADDFETVNINVEGDGVLFGDLEFYDNGGNDFALNIVANGDLTIEDDLNLNGNVGSTTITVSGSGNVDLGEVDMDNDGDPTTVMTINAAALTGNLTVLDGNGWTTAAGIDSITSGSGNDKITLAGYTTVVQTGAGNDTVDMYGLDYGHADAKTLDGGDGDDAIVINNGALLDAETAANISNFEILDFSKGTGTYDLSIEASLDDLRATGSIAAAVTITEFDADNSLTLTAFSDTDDITVTLATDGATDAMTVNVVAKDTTENNTADGVTDADLVLDEVETLTINSTANNAVGDVDAKDVVLAASKYLNVVDLNASDMTRLVVTGDAKTTVIFTGAEALTQIDASANTAGVIVDASLGGIVAGISFKGTAQADTFTATANGDTIQTGGGADSITLGAGEDTVRYVAKGDSTLTLTDTTVPADDVADTATGYDVISGFTTGDDIIELSSSLGLATGDARSALLQLGSWNVADAKLTAAQLQTAIGDGVDFFSTGLVDRAVAFASNDAATAGNDQGFVFIDVNSDGNFTQADDMMIELAGVVTLTITDFQFG